MLPTEEQRKTPDDIKNNDMEKNELCSCTPGYYCPDENQYEPGYQCDLCEYLETIERAVANIRRMMYKPDDVVIPVENEVIDDLPF